MESLNVLLVDDSDQFLQTAYDYFDDAGSVNIVGTAQSGEDAIQQTVKLKPDVVFMDISLPGINGIEAARRIKEAGHSPYIVMLTLYNSMDYRCEATAAGADAFIQKDRLAAEISDVIKAVTESRQMRNQFRLPGRRRASRASAYDRRR